MIVVQNHLRIKKEFSERFEKSLSERSHTVDGFPGFIRNEVLRPVQGDSYIVMTYWNSLEDFNRWVGSEEFSKSHSESRLPKDAYAGKGEITVHQVI
ncbi:MAG: antibiotic biosynthesis monooxygenase [Thermoplasmataceae archaeon]